MKQFFSFVRKEFFHILRDSRTVLILLGIPVVQIILFGFAITTEVKNARVAVVDYSNDPSTDRLTRKLAASSYFTITHRVGHIEEVNTLFREGKIDLGIVFGADYEAQTRRNGSPYLQIIADASDPNSGQMIASYAQMVLLTDPTPTPALSGGPEILSQMLYNPGMKGAYNFVPGVMAMILLLICAMMTSISIVREKETGTMEVLLVSPVRPLHIILAKMVPYFVLSLVNLTTILLLSVYVLEVPVAGSLFQLILLSLIYIFVGLALGLLISTLANNQVTAMMISGMVLMMPVIWFSGMMFPVENMPKVLQALSSVMPARWYLSAVKKVMIQGLDLRFAATEVGVLLAMAVVLVIVSWKKFKNKLS